MPDKPMTDTHGATSSVATRSGGQGAEKIAPALLAALISGGASILGGLFSGGGASGEYHPPERVPDPYRDPLTELLGARYEGLVGQPRPAYPGQLSAGYNPALLAALQNVMGVSQGATAGSPYSADIQSLMERFTSPRGSTGWSPTLPFWRNIPRAPGQSPPSGNPPPRRPTGRQSPEAPPIRRPTGRQTPTGG